MSFTLTEVQTGMNVQANTTPNSLQSRKIEVARILSVGSSSAIVSINKNVISNNRLHLVQLGTVLSILTNTSIVVAMVSSLKIGGTDEEGLHDGCIAQLDIMGEITTNPTTKLTRFNRGVRTFPVLNQPVYTMTPLDLEIIFATGSAPSIEIGRLQQDSSIPARVRTNDLLSKHFAIIGSTGSGKSCTVALVLQAILDENPDAHVVLFDPHNEYSKSFGDKAFVIGQSELDLPIWLFDFEETAELLTSEILDHKHAEIEVLSEIILKAKQLYDRLLQQQGQGQTQAQGLGNAQEKLEDVEKDLHRVASHISLDSPVPYRMRDVLKLLDYHMGLLENSNNLAPYKRLKRRIEILMADPRYKFIFKNQATPASIKNITGTIFRIPVQGKPICILDFSGIPSEALNVVVSVVSRLAFELAMWSKRSIPILLVCEEAHRYIPSDPSLGFKATRRSISRIAKEGRKYGVSLCIVSQRPSELEPSTLSQCSTIFSMRLSNERDQNFVRAAIPDGAGELLSFLPNLGTAETMVFGESVNLPMRVILNTLPADRLPHSSSAKFTDLWCSGDVSDLFMDEVFESWRTRSFERKPNVGVNVAQQPGVVPSQLRQAHGVQTSVVNEAIDPSSGRNIAEVKRMLNEAFHKNL
ncbi:MAG: hypothetical protein COA69_05015 [Robiginitomaculum sp.]|nr:MAG: hypothetical protein COA69_05015 [Robiginitomaculum sp.]